jgi:hypothetical protein
MHISVMNIVNRSTIVSCRFIMWISYFVIRLFFLFSVSSTGVIYNPPCRGDPGARVGSRRLSCRRRRINRPCGDPGNKRFSASPMWDNPLDETGKTRVFFCLERVLKQKTINQLIGVCTQGPSSRHL